MPTEISVLIGVLVALIVGIYLWEWGPDRTPKGD